MGNKIVTFTEQQLEDYQVSWIFLMKKRQNDLNCKLVFPSFYEPVKDCSYFTRKDILK